MKNIKSLTTFQNQIFGKWNRNRKQVFQLFYEKLELGQKKSHSQSCRNEHCKRDCGLKNMDSCFTQEYFFSHQQL